MKKGKNWTKVVARNYYPLQAFAVIYQKQEGIKLGKLSWKFLDDLIIKYGSPLTEFFFSIDSKSIETNISDYLKTPNKDIEGAIQIAVNEIKDNLKAKSGKTPLEAENLYKRAKRSQGLMVIGYNWLFPIEKKLEDVMGKSRWNIIRDTVFVPFYKTVIAREHDLIIKAHNQYLKNKDESFVQKEAESLAKEFGYIHSEYRAREWSVKDYEMEIKNLKVTDTKNDTKKIKFDFSEKELWLIEIAQKIIYIYDEGKSAVVRTNWALRKTVENLKFNEQQVFGCTEREFLAWTKGSRLPSLDVLKNRGLNYGILLKNGVIKEYLTKTEVESLIKQENITEFSAISKPIKELKGNCAWKGNTKGRVRIVYSQKDAEQFQEGEILVASMTTPELISAMRKAAAFVTDEGGIMTHAAIIARELNKPCIVATKIATKILKDGDLVEVDAERGIVKIIERGSENLRLINKEEQATFVKKIKKINWMYWVNRPYPVFIGTICWDGVMEKYFERMGFKGLGPNNNFYQFPDLYYDKMFLERGVKYFNKYFETNKMSSLSDSFQVMHKHHISELEKIISDNTKTITQKLFVMSDLIKDYMPFLWIVILLEEHFSNRIALEVPKYIKGDYSRFIGDVSVPSKKNVYVLMQDEIRSGTSIKKIAEKYGWMKSRDGFTDFYTEGEIIEIKNGLKEIEKPVKITIPKALTDLVEELKELNFFRTDRTDKLYEFLAIARRLMVDTAKHIKTDFKELSNYDFNSIVLGKPQKYNKNFSYGLINNCYTISNSTLVLNLKKSDDGIIVGQVAFKGNVRGIVKIVTHPNDVSKVKTGEILVAQMTLPSFISAMQKASAFVTDEGGITCHAAIIAREMKKPCIIGTKNATKVLKDGDLVEVDAERGIVKIIERGSENS